jgi:hypothetical protein
MLSVSVRVPAPLSVLLILFSAYLDCKVALARFVNRWAGPNQVASNMRAGFPSAIFVGSGRGACFTGS